MTTVRVLDEILGRFSFLSDSLKLSFAYGSALFSQKGNKVGVDGSKNMIDVCLVVEDTAKFHQNNLRINPSDYSLIGKLGYKFVDKVQTMPCGVYFNTLIQLDADTLFKYGVISSKVLKKDLVTWDTLYYSGRLHKPVKFIRLNKESEREGLGIISKYNNKWFDALQQFNLRNAWNVAILMNSLPQHNKPKVASQQSLSTTPKLTLRDIFVSVCDISYNGDFRMIFGEDKKKVEKIVDSNLEHFYELYKNNIDDDRNVELLSDWTIEIDQSQKSFKERISLLPKRITRNVKLDANCELSTEEMVMTRDQIRDNLRKIVWRSSILQSVKNIPTAGLFKSISYSSQKVAKMKRSSNEQEKSES